MTRGERKRVVIAGGGVAALEALLALRELAGPLVEIQLVAREPSFAHRALSVAEPFDRGAGQRFDLAEIAADQNAELLAGTVEEVDADERVVITREGDSVPFDFLVVAVGARQVTAIPGALTFRGAQDSAAMRELLEELGSAVRSVAFALPVGIHWPLPLYELALLTSAHCSANQIDAALTLVTGETAPLELFGPTASDAVAVLMRKRKIALRTQTRAIRVEPGLLHVAGAQRVAADRVIALPRLEGPEIEGLPLDTLGFVPTDAYGAVKGLANVYAAGDAVAFPLKQGGLAAQQADAVAQAIAAELGAPVEPQPFRPVMRGLLLTGGVPTYLRAEPGAQRADATVAVEAVASTSAGRRIARGQSVASTSALWWPPSKIAGRYLAPYLATARPAPLSSGLLADRPAPAPRFPPVEVEHEEALALTLLLADDDADWGDYHSALQALSAAEALNGSLPRGYAAKRERWQREIGGTLIPASPARATDRARGPA
jgi:sulfide:quinone oxidoreductase